MPIVYYDKKSRTFKLNRLFFLLKISLFRKKSQILQQKMLFYVENTLISFQFGESCNIVLCVHANKELRDWQITIIPSLSGHNHGRPETTVQFNETHEAPCRNFPQRQRHERRACAGVFVEARGLSCAGEGTGDGCA